MFCSVYNGNGNGIGRFLQTDPMGYIDTVNPYAYCANNPLNWIDPWGLRKKDSENQGALGKIIEFITNIFSYASPESSSTLAGGAAALAIPCNEEAKKRARYNKLIEDTYRNDDPYRPETSPTPYIYLGSDTKTGKDMYILKLK
jgi:hypothetical protein